MSTTYSAGFFIVPAGELRRLHELVGKVNSLPVNASDHERHFHQNQIFAETQNVAVVSEVVTGTFKPAVEPERGMAYFTIRSWLWTQLLNNDGAELMEPDQLESLVRKFDKTSSQELLEWYRKNGVFKFKPYDRIIPPFLTELYEALARVLRAKPHGAYGFVCANFRHDYRDRPPPEPDEPEDTMTAEDGAKQKEMIERRLQARISRQRCEWWADTPHQGRILIGMVGPERAAELDREYCAARTLLSDGKIRAGLVAMNRHVVPQIEQALINPVLETMSGPVELHEWLKLKTKWDTNQRPRAVCTLEQAIELDQLLEERDEDQLIESIWEMELHWTRDQIRETYHRFRSALKSAIEHGQGFAWLYDRNE